MKYNGEESISVEVLSTCISELDSLIKLYPTSYIRGVSRPRSGGTEEKERSNLYSSHYMLGQTCWRTLNSHTEYFMVHDVDQFIEKTFIRHLIR